MPAISRPGLSLAVLLAWSVVLAADVSRTKDGAPLVTVRGCLHGLVLTTVDDTGTNAVVHRPVTLRGDRETEKQLKALSNHFVEVTGVLKGGDDHTGVRIAEKPIPKGRIYAGVGSTPVAAPSQPQADPVRAATLDVKKVADINRCS